MRTPKRKEAPMADMLPKIVEAAKNSGHVRVRCERANRMAKELRKHLPGFVVTADEERRLVEVKRRPPPSLPGSCSTGPTCSPLPPRGAA